jgi:uncharacterized lipoprotein YddW (UPF0748 family)
MKLTVRFKIWALTLLALFAVVFPQFNWVEAAEKLQIIKMPGLSESRLQPVLKTLKQGGVSYSLYKENQMNRLDATDVLLPLANTLSDEQLKSLEKFLEKGGRLVLIPPEEYPDMNTFKLFKDLDFTLSGSSFVPQTQELLWQAKVSQTRDFLAVGSKVLMLDPTPGSVVMANWGETYPAVIKSSKGAFMNWDWGRELTPNANIEVLSFLLSPNSVAAMKTIQEKPPEPVAQTPTAQVAANPDGSTPLPSVDYGTHFKHMRDMDDYKRFVYNNIEAALQLSESVDVDQAERLMLKAEDHKSKYEQLFLSGNAVDGELEFEKAKNLMLKALVLASPSTKIEGRAIWLDRGSIVSSGSPEGLKALMKKLDDAGINVVYFETLNAGYPVYPSRYLPQNPLIQGWDPLKVAVDEGHKLGMEVHAWVWCFAVGNKKHNDVIYKPGDYAGPVLADKGLMSEALRMSNSGLVPNRQTEFWLSPASPKGRQFLKNVYSEIVSNYPVDGVQLDYIRFPFQNSQSYMGYDAVTRERFESETGMSLGAMSDATMKTWVAWKTHQVNTFVKDISETLKGIRPSVKLSAAVFPLPRASRLMAIQQDWETWVNNGWIDTLSPMTYSTSPDEYQRTIDRVATSADRPIIVYPGLAINRMDSVDLLNMVQAARRRGAMGTTIFAMAHLDQLKMQSLGQGPYKAKKPIPPHRDHVLSLATELKELETQFNKLVMTKSIETLTPTQMDSIRKHFAQSAKLVAFLKSQQQSGQMSEQAATEVSEAIRTEVRALDAEMQPWIEAERPAQPYRSLHFRSAMSRINNLCGYSMDRVAGIVNPTPGRVTAKAAE